MDSSLVLRTVSVKKLFKLPRQWTMGSALSSALIIIFTLIVAFKIIVTFKITLATILAILNAGLAAFTDRDNVFCCSLSFG